MGIWGGWVWGVCRCCIYLCLVRAEYDEDGSGVVGTQVHPRCDI